MSAVFTFTAAGVPDGTLLQNATVAAGGPWVKHSGADMAAADNAIVCGSDPSRYYATAAYGPNPVATVTVSAVAAGSGQPLVALRMDRAAQTFYLGGWLSNRYTVFRFDAGGTAAEVASGAGTIAAGDRIGFGQVVNGDGSVTLTVLKNGVAVSGATYTDPSPLPETHTAGFWNASGSITAFAVTDAGQAATPALNVVWHGDSLTNGQLGSNAGTTSAPRLAAVLAGLGVANVTASNQGNQGHTITQMIGELPAINALYDAGKAVNVLVVQGGHNDLNQGATAADVLSRWQTYFAAALAAHPWRVVLATEPDATGSGLPAAWTAAKNVANAALAQKWRGWGVAAFSDISRDVRIGVAGAGANTTYFQPTDHVHLTDAGYGVWGQYDLAAVQQAITSPQPPLPAAADVRSGTDRGDGTAGTLAATAGGLTTEQAQQLATVATEIVKVPRSGVAHRYSRPGVVPVTVAVEEAAS